jgi:hypothetical protein
MKALLTVSLTLLSLSLGSRLGAQATTGVPFVNDLRVLLPPTYLPQGSGATSCTPASNLGFIPGAPFVVAYDLSTTTATGAILLLDFFNPCNSPGINFGPAQPVGCAGPVAGGTNLWFALSFSPMPVPVPGLTNSAGYTRWNFNVPPGPGQVWAQAFILDACSGTSFKFSQALGFSW